MTGRETTAVFLRNPWKSLIFWGKKQGKNTCLGSAWLNDLGQWSPAKLEDGKPNRSGSVGRALSRTLDDMGIQATNKRWFQRPKHIDLMGSSTTAAKTSMNGCVQYSGSQIWYHKPTLSKWWIVGDLHQPRSTSSTMLMMSAALLTPNITKASPRCFAVKQKTIPFGTQTWQVEIHSKLGFQ